MDDPSELAPPSAPPTGELSRDPAAHYEARLAELGREDAVLARQDDGLSRYRGLTFLASLGLAGYGLFRSSPPIWAAAGLAFAAFLVFVVRHAMVSTRRFDIERQKTLATRAQERMAGRYRAPEAELHRRGDAFVDPEHPYASDLDLFGAASLFEQLNQTQTSGGAELLARWLREAASPATARARQAAARELSETPELREQMALAGMRAGDVDRNVTRLVEWGTGSAEYARGGLPIALGSLGLVAVSLGLAVMMSLHAGIYTRLWLGSLGLNLLVLMATRNRLAPVIEPVCIQQSPLAKYRDLFALAENARFAEPALERVTARLSAEGGAAHRIARLERLVSLASIRHNALGLLFANLFLLWDVWLAYLIDAWRRDHGPAIAGWLDTLAELEALASLATFAFEHPDFCWPTIEDGEAEPRFEATELGHPLLPPERRVVNDVALDHSCRALMITGSNMSGKSTMLRSMGVAAVLAQCGAPVCARRLSTSPLSVYTSMRIGDALDRGASRFFMEVRKMKAVVDAVDGERPLLFLLDEVLHGTNSRERNIGAKAVVRHLVAHGAIGAVSSHDLGLVELESLTEGLVHNVHFEDHIEDGKMCFDYRMKPGPVSTSNALRLMRAVGIDVVGLDDDSQR
ncbi:MAG: DNA mismatch repair protein MutS [Myxococcales bacterium]|nr:DNA mismatch repair protein MutS [Myxococcales bacterium]